MPNFGKKCKKQLKRIFLSKIFSCVCFQEHKSNSEPSSASDTIASQKLEILLLKTLQNQLEEREYHDQLKTTLLNITKALEHIGKNYELQQMLSQRFPNDGFSNFTISVSKNSLIHCQTDIRSKSLVVLNESNVTPMVTPFQGNSSVVLHQCHELFDISKSVFPHGQFSSVLYKFSNDKAVQYDLMPSYHSPFLSHSKLIQTELLNLSNFNIAMFKINLVKHIKNLKYDVITLRQLLKNVENSSTKGCLKTHGVSNCTKNVCDEDVFEGMYYEAKIRAANFVKFYKLRKAGEKGNKNKRKGTQKKR